MHAVGLSFFPENGSVVFSFLFFFFFFFFNFSGKRLERRVGVSHSRGILMEFHSPVVFFSSRVTSRAWVSGSSSHGHDYESVFLTVVS